MTAGLRSTEFWVAFIVLAAGLGIVAVGLVSGRDAQVVAGAACLCSVVLGYSNARGSAKGRPYLPPAGRL